MPVETGIDPQQLFAASQLLSELTGERVQANKAIVGRNAFAHEAGIHQDGMLKDRRTYEIMRPEDVGVPQHDARAGQAFRPATPCRSAASRSGLTLTRQQLDEIYRRMVALADEKKHVTDDDRQIRGLRIARRAVVRGTHGRVRRVKASIVLLPGDGIGPDVIAAAVQVLEIVGGLFGHTWTFTSKAFGGAALRQNLPPLPDDTLAAALSADAVLLGAAGDPAFDHLPPSQRPEAGLLGLRREMGVFANLRPARSWPGLEEAGPLKPSVLAGTDLVVVRELLGGLYYGQPRGRAPLASAATTTPS